MATLYPGQAQQSAIKRQQGSDNSSGASASATRWTLATRIGFRFCFAYLLLYSLTAPVGIFENLAWYIVHVDIPSLGRVWPMRQITFWTAEHLFHLAVSPHLTGSGDTAFDWVRIFCVLVVAVIATAVWSLLDGRRDSYVPLHKWFRLALRFALAAVMFIYGFIKVIPLQMPFPPLMRLEPVINFMRGA
jgi:hypothetical protein